jgi:hypothetical protein
MKMQAGRTFSERASRKVWGTRKCRRAVPHCGTMRRTPRHELFKTLCVCELPEAPAAREKFALKKHRASRSVRRVRPRAPGSGENGAMRPTQSLHRFFTAPRLAPFARIANNGAWLDVKNGG